MKSKVALMFSLCIAILAIVVVFINERRDVVRLAINLPLTGPVAAITGNYHKGLRMGVDDACKEYDIDPSTIEIVVDDNKASPSESASVYSRQTMKKVDAFITGTTESATVILPQIDNLHDVPNFLIAFDSFLTKDGNQRFRLFPSFKTESEMWISYVAMMKPRKVVTLTLNIPATEEQFSKIICPYIEKTGASVFRERFDFSTTDFRTIGLRIKEKNPDFVLISGYSFQLNVAIKALQELSVVPNEHIMCSMDFCDFLKEKDTMKAFSGIAFAAPNFIVNSTEGKTCEWINRFKARFNVNPTYTEAYAYDLGCLFVRSLHIANDVKPSSLLKAVPFDGITGKVQFDKDRDSACTLSLVTIGSDGIISVMK